MGWTVTPTVVSAPEDWDHALDVARGARVAEVLVGAGFVDPERPAQVYVTGRGADRRVELSGSPRALVELLSPVVRSDDSLFVGLPSHPAERFFGAHPATPQRAEGVSPQTVSKT